jgi:hypothetical protein
LPSEELDNLYSSPNIIRQIKSSRMTWAEHLACMGQERKLYNVLAGTPKERDHSEDQGVDGREGSKMELMDSGLGVLSGFSWLMLGSCERCDEPSSSGATDLVSY